MTSIEDLTQLEKEINAARWRASKLKDHEYVLERDYPDLFSKMKEIVKEHGQWEPYKHYRQRYWHFKGYKYWVMPGVRGIKPYSWILNRTNQP